MKGGSPIQRVEEDKKESNEVVWRVNKSEGCLLQGDGERERERDDEV